MAEEKLENGRVARVIGPVVDAEFPPDGLPEIHTALRIDVELEGETRASPARWPSTSATGWCERSRSSRPTA